MKIHGRDVEAVSKIPEVKCSPGCHGGTHVDTIWLPEGWKAGRVVGAYYAMTNGMLALFDARRVPEKDNRKPDLAIARDVNTGEVIGPQDVNTEAWEVRWKWADEKPIRNAHLN